MTSNFMKNITHTQKCYIEYWKPVQVHLLERPFKQNHTYFTILHLCLNAFGYTSQTDPLIAHIRDLLGSTLILKNLHIVFFLYWKQVMRKWEGTGMWLSYSCHEARMYTQIEDLTSYRKRIFAYVLWLCPDTTSGNSMKSNGWYDLSAWFQWKRTCDF